jgi:methylglyoxal synthase
VLITHTTANTKEPKEVTIMSEGEPSGSGYLRASTAHVEMQQIRQAMQALEEGFKRRNSVQSKLGIEEAALLATLDESPEDYDPGIIPFDGTKHILEYLPTPYVLDNDDAGDDIDQSSGSVGQTSSRRTMAKSIGSSSKFLGIQEEEGDNTSSFTSVIGDDINMDPEFGSMFAPGEMRLLALVSHNNMKHSMKQFVIANKNVLKKFRLTGTNTTMTMLKEVFGEDPEVMYGPKCKSGPLGGDAQLVAMAVTGQLGGCIFFIDPMDSHPHSADIECLVRQGNVHNILMMNNPTTAHICLNSLRVALKMGRMEMMPSFFFDLESPSVEAYKMRQNEVLRSTMAKPQAPSSPLRSSVTQSARDFVTAPTSILKSTRREKDISESMEKANRMSLEHKVSNALMRERSVNFLSDGQKSPSGSAENFLPADGDKGEDKVEKGVPEKKKKKKKFFGLIGAF